MLQRYWFLCPHFFQYPSNENAFVTAYHIEVKHGFAICRKYVAKVHSCLNNLVPSIAWDNFSKYTVGVKSMSPADIELLFVILYNITALHHNTNLFSLEIK